MARDDGFTLGFVFEIRNPILCVISKSTMCNYGNHWSSQRPLCFQRALAKCVVYSVYCPSPLTSYKVCLEKPISVFGCHGKLQGLFAIWSTWKCCDSIRIPFNSICYTGGNHCGQWWPIIHGKGLFSFPQWRCVSVCVCVSICPHECIISPERLSMHKAR